MHLPAFTDHHHDIGEENIHLAALVKFDCCQSLGVSGTFTGFDWQAGKNITTNLLEGI